MARSVGNEIPLAIRPLLSGDDLAARQGLTFLLLSVTDEGWPHLAMLSVGELIASGPRELRLALWRNSTAARNLARAGRASLALVHAGAGYSLRLSTRQGPDIEGPLSGRLASFGCTVEDALVDEAPYAELTSGVTYRLIDPADVLPRWQEAVAALSRAGT